LILGSGSQALKLVLRLTLKAQDKYGVFLRDALTQTLAWAHACQRADQLIPWYQGEAGRQREKGAYQRRKQAGLCVACGKPALPGYAKCQKCLEKSRTYYCAYKRKV